MKKITLVFSIQLFLVFFVFSQQDEARKKLDAFNYFQGSWTVNVEAPCQLKAHGIQVLQRRFSN